MASMSQLRAFRPGATDLCMAISGTAAGTGKSYLLRALTKLLKAKHLVVAELAPSGGAAHAPPSTIASV